MAGHIWRKLNGQTLMCQECGMIRRWQRAKGAPHADWHYYRDARARKRLTPSHAIDTWPEDLCHNRPLEEPPHALPTGG